MRNRRYWLGFAMLVALVADAAQPVQAQNPTPAATPAARNTLALTAGCTTVSLDYAAATPLSRIAADVQPASALRGIFRAEGRGFRAFSPGAPAGLNDYNVIGARNEAAFLCVGVAASFLMPAPVIDAPPLVPGTVISVPERVTRPQVVEVQIATGPYLACVGGVNIPTAGPTIRWERIEAAGGAAGVAVIKFGVLQDDLPGLAQLAVRCADGQFVRLWIQIV